MKCASRPGSGSSAPLATSGMVPEACVWASVSPGMRTRWPTSSGRAPSGHGSAASVTRRMIPSSTRTAAFSRSGAPVPSNSRAPVSQSRPRPTGGAAISAGDLCATCLPVPFRLYRAGRYPQDQARDHRDAGEPVVRRLNFQISGKCTGRARTSPDMARAVRNTTYLDGREDIGKARGCRIMSDWPEGWYRDAPGPRGSYRAGRPGEAPPTVPSPGRSGWPEQPRPVSAPRPGGPARAGAGGGSGASRAAAGGG